MQKVFLIACIMSSAMIAFAQPTPRAGQTPNAPNLMPRSSNAPSNATQMRARGIDSAAPPSSNAAVLPSNLQMPPVATQRPGELVNTVPRTQSQVNRREASGIKWMSLEEALEKSKTEKRKIVIDVYTDWCGWCKRMDQTTFADQDIAAYVNEHYYPVKFNAEQQEDVVFKGKTYQFKRNGSRGYHELAAEWLNNRMGYPTVVFLDEDFNVIQPLPGFQDAEKFDAVVHYFGSDSHKTTPWETFERKYNDAKKAE